MTEHHVLVLFPHRLVAVNVVSGRVVQQLPLTGRHAIGVPLGLATDAATGTVYLFTGAAAASCGSTSRSAARPQPPSGARSCPACSRPPGVQPDHSLPAELAAALPAAGPTLRRQ